MEISGERINMGSLKSWILTTFYKNELLAIQKEYERKVKEINYEDQKKTKLIDTVHRVFGEPNHVIIGVETNKIGDEVLVVQWIHSKDIWIMLYNDKYKACNNHFIFSILGGIGNIFQNLDFFLLLVLWVDFD